MNKDHLDKISYLCHYCEYTFEESEAQQQHISHAHQFNCMECDHQATTEEDLQKHMKYAQKVNCNEDNLQFNCNSCAHKFATYFSLMNHRRDSHGKTKEKCKYNVPPSSCKRGPVECWNDHSPVIEGSEEFKCTVCEDKFTSIPQMRRHQKI